MKPDIEVYTKDYLHENVVISDIKSNNSPQSPLHDVLFYQIHFSKRGGFKKISGKSVYF